MRGKHDTLGSMSAGAMTGALYKSTGKLSTQSPVEIFCPNRFSQLELNR